MTCLLGHFAQRWLILRQVQMLAFPAHPHSTALAPHLAAHPLSTGAADSLRRSLRMQTLLRAEGVEGRKMWSVQGVLVVLRVGDPMGKWGWGVGRVGRTFSSLTRFLGHLGTPPRPLCCVIDTQKQSVMGGDVWGRKVRLLETRIRLLRCGKVCQLEERSVARRAWSTRPSGCGAQAASLRATYGGKGRSQGTRCRSWAGLQWRPSQPHARAPPPTPILPRDRITIKVTEEACWCLLNAADTNQATPLIPELAQSCHLIELFIATINNC